MSGECASSACQDKESSAQDTGPRRGADAPGARGPARSPACMVRRCFWMPAARPAAAAAEADAWCGRIADAERMFQWA